MKSYGFLLTIVVVMGVILLSIFGYAYLLEQNSRLINSLDQQEAQLQAMDLEKKDLLRELKGITQQKEAILLTRAPLKEALLASQGQVVKLNRIFSSFSRIDEELALRVEQVKQENLSLAQARNAQETRFADLVKENDDFRARISSIPELKKAIREFKNHTFVSR